MTKTFPLSDVQILHELGVSEFGENRDQEGRGKAPHVPGKWHFQGQLQSNKLNSICNWADVIQTIDSTRYVELVGKAARNHEKQIEVFIQVSLEDQAAEHRGGARPELLNQIADAIMIEPNLKLQGLMTVAPLGERPEAAFERLAKIRAQFQANYPAPYLSAGMSGDYLTAISFGATHVRIGSSILGSRDLAI